MVMKTLTVNMSDQEAEEYKFSADEMNLDELLKKVRKKNAFEALERVRQSAKASGLDKMTMEEIDAEIQAVRNAKRNS